MPFTKGFDAIKEEADRESERRQKRQESQDKKMNYISWKANETKILRFITDDVLSVGIHDFVTTNKGSKQSFVCARELAEPRDCLICDTMTDAEGKSLWPRKNILGLAAEREMVPGKKGEPATFRDKIDPETGQPVIGLVKQKDGNFWKYITRYYARYGTTVDRDYEIERTGGGLETDYGITPFDADPDFKKKEVVAEHYAEALTKIPSLEDWIDSQGSEEKYEYFFDVEKSKPVEPSPWDNSSRLLGKETDPADPWSGKAVDDPPFDEAPQVEVKPEGKPVSLTDRLKQYQSVK